MMMNFLIGYFDLAAFPLSTFEMNFLISVLI